MWNSNQQLRQYSLESKKEEYPTFCMDMEMAQFIYINNHKVVLNSQDLSQGGPYWDGM